MFCTFTLLLSEVYARYPEWLFAVFPWCHNCQASSSSSCWRWWW